MGLLIDGVWHDRWYDTQKSAGHFQRQESVFRNHITADGRSGFAAAAGRYHLYVSYACPWAHRTLIFRKLKRLEAVISVSTVDWRMLENGWEFTETLPDPLYGSTFLHQIYTRARPDYTGRVTVPVLWDKHTHTIVNNESAEIIRMLNTAFDAFTDIRADFYPPALRDDIDALNRFIYDNINNGVYKAGFATTQAAYDAAVTALFDALDTLEARLGDNRYLIGDTLTEADWRLFTTLLRFDPVYVGHFKCNKKMLKDYPNLSGYLRELYQWPGIAETVHMDHIKGHYYQSHRNINPTGIVPAGPVLDLDAPHGRG